MDKWNGPALRCARREWVISKIEAPNTIDDGHVSLIDCNGEKLLLPGFVNGHTHAAMSLLRGLGEETPLMSWLKEQIWPVEARLTPEYIYWGTALALLEMASCGVTCFGDMYFEMDQVAQVSLAMGMKCALSRGLIGEDQKRVDENRNLSMIGMERKDFSLCS